MDTYKTLGSSSLKVSRICLGTNVFGRSEGHWTEEWPHQLDEEQAHQILDRFVELGGNFIDTAAIYSKGLSEVFIGNWLQKNDRSKLVLLSKVGFQGNKQANLKKQTIQQTCDECLKRLKTDFLDIFMQQYNLVNRHGELEEFAVCKSEGISVIPWGALLGGVLTNKYSQGITPTPDSGRIGFVNQHEEQALRAAPTWRTFANDNKYWQLRKLMDNIAKNHGASVSQVSLRWLMQKDIVGSIAVSATSIHQLNDNLAANSWSLTIEEMEKLDQQYPVNHVYPYEMTWEINGGIGGVQCQNFTVQNIYT